MASMDTRKCDWEFMQHQLEQARRKELTVGTFASFVITGFWRDHAPRNLRTRKAYKILGFLSPCWGKKYMEMIFSAGKTLFDLFNLLSMSINLLLALYLVFPGYLFNICPTFMFSRETLRID